MKTSAFLFLVVLILSCRTKGLDAEMKAEFAPDGVPIDWGNLHPMSSTPLTVEAMLANAAAIRLNEAAQLTTLLSGFSTDTEILDGIVSVPIKMLSNDQDGHNHPFGDGQKNASLGWVGWPTVSTEPPLIMTLAHARTSSSEYRLLVLEPSAKMIALLLGEASSTISAELSDGQNHRFTIELKKDEQRNVYRAVVVLGTPNGRLNDSEDYPIRRILLKDLLGYSPFRIDGHGRRSKFGFT